MLLSHYIIIILFVCDDSGDFIEIDHASFKLEYRIANTFVRLQNMEVTTEKGKTRIF